GGAASGAPQPDRHGGGEKAARYVADRARPPQGGPSQREGDPQKTDPLGQNARGPQETRTPGWERAAARTAAPQPPNTSQNVPKNSAATHRPISLCMTMSPLIVCLFYRLPSMEPCHCCTTASPKSWYHCGADCRSGLAPGADPRQEKHN